MSTPQKRFQLTLRDFFWMMTLVAVLLGWFLNDLLWRRLYNKEIIFLSKESLRLSGENTELGNANRQLEGENIGLRDQSRTNNEMFSRMQKTLHDSIQDKNK